MSGDKVWYDGAWVDVCPVVATGGVESVVRQLVTVSPSTAGVAHDPGSWVEVTASVAFDVSWMWVEVGDTFSSGANSSTLLDIGTGAAASETAVVSNIPIGYRDDTLIAGFPVAIAAGTRIAVRVRGAQTSNSKDLRILLGSNGIDVADNPTTVTMGANTAASKGVSLADPAGADTNTPVWGAWTEITASTPSDLAGVLFLPQLDSGAAIGGSYVLRLDFGYGGSGSEASFGFNSRWTCSNNEIIYPQGPNIALTNSFVYANIPAGTRLVARYARGGSAVDLDVVALGIPTSTNYNDLVMSLNPIAYWPMQETSGLTMTALAGSDGTYSALRTPDLGVAGPSSKIPNAVDFDRTNDETASAPLDLSSYAEVSISCWLWIDTYNNSDNMALELGNPNTQKGLSFNPNFNGGTFSGIMSEGGSGFRGYGFTRPSTGAWHHYVCRMSRSAGTVTFVVDGVVASVTLQDSLTMTGNFINSTLYFMSRNGSTLYCDGKLTQVAVFAGLLSDSDSALLYRAGI